MAIIRQTFDASGTWTVPPGVVQAAFIGWGCGAPGLLGGGGLGGQGGGGGAMATKGTVATPDVAVVPGDVYTITIGAAGSATDTQVVKGAPILVANCATSFNGGLAASSTGDITRNGGNGASASGSDGGGGGGTASDTTNAANGSGTTGGAGPSGTFSYTAGGTGGNSPTGAAAAPGAGGGGGNGAGSTAGGAGADGRVIVLYITYDLPPINSGSRQLPIPGTDFAPPFPGAVIAFAGRSPPATPPVDGQIYVNSGRPVQEAIPPDPFAGRVQFWTNPVGDPPVSDPYSGQFATRVETVSPAPFPGAVISLRNPFGPTPPANPLTNSYRPIAETTPPFPGAVLHALSTPYGIEPLPPKPMRVAAESPPPFMGGVIAGRATVTVANPQVRPVVVRTSEASPEIQPVRFASGTPAREAVSRGPVVIQPERPPEFGGAVAVGRSAFGLPAVPLNHPVVISPPTAVLEPGRVTFFAGRDTPAPTPRPMVVMQSPSEPILAQPKSSSGTPPRDAVINTATVVRMREEPQREPGRVIISRPSFGLTSLPSRPVVVRMTEGISQIEPGRALYSRPTEAAPVLPPRSMVIWSESVRLPEPGRVAFRRGESAPNVIPRQYVIAGNTAHPEVSQPFFGWGLRTGTGDPPALPLGAFEILYGYGDPIQTLTSEDCEC